MIYLLKMRWKCILKDDPRSCEKLKEIYSVIKQLKKDDKIDVRLKDGKLNAAADTLVQFGLKDLGQGFAHKLEIHLVTYE